MFKINHTNLFCQFFFSSLEDSELPSLLDDDDDPPWAID